MPFNYNDNSNVFLRNFQNGTKLFNTNMDYRSNGTGNNFFNQQKSRANNPNLANNNFIRLGSMSYNASQDPYSQSLNQPLNNGNANSLANNQFIQPFTTMQQNAMNNANARFGNADNIINTRRGTYASTYQNLQPLASANLNPRERLYAMGDWAMGTLQDEKDMMNQNILNKYNAQMANDIMGQRERAYQNNFANSLDYGQYANDAMYRNASLANEQARLNQNKEQWEQEQAYKYGQDTLDDLYREREYNRQIQEAQQRQQQEIAKRYNELRKSGETHNSAIEKLNGIFGEI